MSGDKNDKNTKEDNSVSASLPRTRSKRISVSTAADLIVKTGSVVRDILEVTLDDVEELNLKRFTKCEEDEDLTKSTFKFDSSFEDVCQDDDDTESTLSNNNDENDENNDSDTEVENNEKLSFDNFIGEKENAKKIVVQRRLIHNTTEKAIERFKNNYIRKVPRENEDQMAGNKTNASNKNVYKCFKCPGNTVISTTHNGHAKLHLNKSRYELEGKPRCSICSLCFSKFQNLHEHTKKIHQIDPLTDNFKINKDGQTYSCKLCNHDEVNGRVSHLKLHSKQEEYKEFNMKCDYCGLFLRSKKALFDHRRKTHPIDYANKSAVKK